MTTVGQLQRQSSVESVNCILEDIFRQYGFDHFIIAGLPERGADFRPFVMSSTWNPEWLARYTREGYIDVDPVAQQCAATSMPFVWSDVTDDPTLGPAARTVISEARDFNMSEGLCIPVHLEGGRQGGVSLAGRTDWLSGEQRLELHMLALYAHGQLRRLHAVHGQIARRAITPREAEVLRWVATGKTASDIADITGLSVRTVNQHCENAQRRLGTSNRLQTVVEALRHNLITF